MQIIKKDISWLIERVPDFPSFYKENELFFVNGFLAGGFLRKIVLNGSASDTISNIRRSNKPVGDIDFFYLTQPDCSKAYDYLLTRMDYSGNYYKFLHGPVSFNPCGEIKLRLPNSKTGYAFEENMMSVDGIIKYQLIYKNTGTPEEVLNKFDISNCKIATDGKFVYMVEDWEELESKKQIRVDNYSGQYIISRLKKYLRDDYEIYPEQKQELLVKLLAAVQETNRFLANGIPTGITPQATNVFNVRTIITNAPRVITIDDILMFYGQLGPQVMHYSMSSLAAPEDFALHMYKKRLPKQV